MDNDPARRRIKILRDFLVICVSILIGVFIQKSSAADLLVKWSSGVYIVPAAVFVGFLFSLTFTAAIATSVFILLSGTTHNPYLIAFFGGIGSVCANAIIYKFFHKEIVSDLNFIEPKYAKKIGHKIMHSRMFVGILPYLAALALISPLPDEIGFLMISGTNFKYTKFFLLSFALHTFGILLIVLFGRSII